MPVSSTSTRPRSPSWSSKEEKKHVSVQESLSVRHRPQKVLRGPAPYYGVIFLREERPLTPEVLTHWAETLSQPLFGQPFSCTLAQVPSRQEAMEQFENEMRLRDEMYGIVYH